MVYDIIIHHCAGVCNGWGRLVRRIGFRYMCEYSPTHPGIYICVYGYIYTYIYMYMLDSNVVYIYTYMYMLNSSAV
jgi:hypothetical protein